MTKPFVYGQHSETWKAPFFSSRGIKYILTMMRVTYSLDGVKNDELPISFQEKGEVIIAVYPNMTREVFVGIHEAANHFGATILEFHSEEDN